MARETPPATRSAPPRRRAALDAAHGATLAVLAWLGASLLGVPELVGFAPPQSVLLAATAGALLAALGARHGVRALQAAAALTALAVVLATSLPLAPALIRPLVRRDTPTAADGAPVDAVAVLSSGVGEDGLVQGQGVDRLLAGLALAQRTGRPLVVSVIHPRRVGDVSSLADQRRIAALAGLADRLFTVDSVGTTHDEALRMSRLARAQGWRRVALVTSPVHTRRACATFERAGLPVVCTPALGRDAVWDGPRALRNGGDRLHATATWLYETLGWLAYRARGWV